MFITSKVEDEEGSIIQVVFAHFVQAQKELNVRILLWLATPLDNLIYNANAIKRGFVSNHDFPHWMDEENKQVINSRYNILSVCYKQVLADMQSKFKHITQF